jgi:hypothetical protein
MWKPFMSNDYLLVTLQTRLNITSLPIPEHNIPRPITTTDPFPVGREADLTCVSGNLVVCKPFLAILAEIVGAIYENLII